MAVATTTASRQNVHAFLRRLPRMLAGAEPDPTGLVQGIQLRMGTALLSKIQQAFIVKSRGGVGEDGIQWPPLQRATVAGRRPPPRKRKGERPRGLLTATQDKRWRGLFAGRLASLLLRGVPEGEAKAMAARSAWSVLKGEGAKTRLDTLGDRQVDILRDTGELFRSLTPGVQGAGQIVRTPPGRLIVGTNKKPWHHLSGRRLFWPTDGTLPAAWWAAILAAGQRGLAAAAMEIVRRAG